MSMSFEWSLSFKISNHDFVRISHLPIIAHLKLLSMFNLIIVTSLKSIKYDCIHY